MIYLNHAALSLTRPEARTDAERVLVECERRLYSATGVEWYRRVIDDCRRTVGALVCARDHAAVAFTANASTAHYLALSSLSWTPGDIVVTTTHENPSIVTQLRALARMGVHVQTIDPASPESFLRDLRTRVRQPAVRAIVTSHVSHVDGRIFPVGDVAALAWEHGCPLIIDGAQAVGHIPVDVDALGGDVYLFTGHKWCAGPLGTGAMVVRDSLFRRRDDAGRDETERDETECDETECDETGRDETMPVGAPTSRFDIGTHNIGLIAGLATACDYRRREGLGTARLTAFREEAKAILGAHPACRVVEWHGPHAPGILTFTGPPGLDHRRFVEQLESECEIVVKLFDDYPHTIAPAVRLSWSSTMNEQDVRNALSTIAQRLARQP